MTFDFFRFITHDRTMTLRLFRRKDRSATPESEVSRCAIYVRNINKRQDQFSSTPNYQEQLLQDYARVHHLHVVKVFEETEPVKWSEKKPQLERLVRLIEWSEIIMKPRN